MLIKKILLLASSFVIVAACTAKAPDTAADEIKLRADAAMWWERYNKGDADGVANLYAEDGIVLAPGVPAAVGREAIRAYIATDIAGSKAAGLTFNGGDISGVGIAGDLAWVSGAFSITDAAGAAVDNGKYLSLFRRMDGGWILIRDTWNSDTAPAAPAPAAPAP